MTSLFDNVSSILFDDKEVASITVDGETVYEKEEPTPVTRTLSFSVKYTDNSPIPSETIFMGMVEDEGVNFQATTDSVGGCTMSDVPDGDYLMYLNDFASKDIVSVNAEAPVIDNGYVVLTVNESSTSFDIIIKAEGSEESQQEE